MRHIFCLGKWVNHETKYMQTKTILLTLLALTLSLTSIAITPLERSYTITGKVTDKGNNETLEYATVKLLKTTDSALITGSITDMSGIFSLKHNEPGSYLLRVNFLGYHATTQVITLIEGQNKLDVGTIELFSDSKELAEVVVEGNKNAVDYHIDKKVLHVSKQFTSVSGSAVDVLQNAPSVKVDIEGNVALRGNSNFTVLIDGRPTVLEASEALQQIPAGSIQDIEIITNPSAKYDPEGTAGIINIITKKRSLEGVSGLVHANAGLDEKYGGDFLLNYRTEHFNYFIGMDYNTRKWPGTTEKETRFYNTDTVILADGERERGGERYSGRAGIEWFPNDKDVFSVAARYGSREHNGYTKTDFTELHEPTDYSQEYTSIEDGGRGGDFYSIESNYTHQFSNKEHRLDAQLMLYNRDGVEENINKLSFPDGSIESGQKSLEFGPSQGLRYRLDYTQPFTEQFTLETGFQGRYRNSAEVNEIYDLDPVDETYIFIAQYSNDVTYLQNIHAMYALGKGEYRGFGYQLGLRTEYTGREIKLTNTGDKSSIDRWDFFPTMHFSYKLSEQHQLMGSYSRRIDRPHGWYLEPFITWTDAFNVRQGNPDLEPEYINAFEMAHQFTFGESALTTEIYHRTTQNNIEWFPSEFDEGSNIMMNQPLNLGKDYSTGVEFAFNTKFFKWWDVDLTSNLYDYRVEGEYNGTDFNENGFTYDIRLNNTFAIGDNTSIQLNPRYSGPEIEPQEEQSAYYRVDGAIRQSFYNKKLQLTLQVRDIFSSGKHEATTRAADIYNYRLYEYKSPIVMFNVTWRINNFKKNGGQPQGEGGEMGGEM
jgi:hypothetical protein